MSPRPPPDREADGFSVAPVLKTPRAAAIAGLLFSVLFAVIVVLIRLSVPADPDESGGWLRETRWVELALSLMPFAGIAFLWFIGVLRDRVGRHEDRFFSTVFFGSGILFLGLLFTLGAVTGGILAAFAAQSPGPIEPAAFHFARALMYAIANVYMAKVAAVFMITTSTVVVYTRITPRWLAILGYVLAALLVINTSYLVAWSSLVLPAWVLLMSCWLLKRDLPGLAGKTSSHRGRGMQV